MSTDLPATLSRLDAWLAEHATLRPSASDAELDALEVPTGLKLPEAFRTLHRWHDGQEWRAGFALGLEFLPLERVRREWEMGRDGRENNPGLNDEIPSVSHPPGVIRDAYTTPGWLGFLVDGGGNSVGIDLNPGPAGTVGQVITFGRDEEDKYVLADSLGDFLREYLGRLESGRATVRRRDDFDEEMWEVELHDATGRPAGGGYTLADFSPGFGAAPEGPRR